MSNLAAPFQHFWINPSTNWNRFFNPQIFISLNSDDADVENHVLQTAGSYGKQLGEIQDVLNILIQRALPKDLTPQEKTCIAQYRETVQRVRQAVRAYRHNDLGPTSADVSGMVRSLSELRETDPAACESLVAQLRKELAETFQ